jgi:DNA-directed RNA polymerase subunit RPC12/RpoP
VDFRSFCDNKGCNKEMRPVVDKETLVAYCAECGKPVNNISVFMRRQMLSHGQVRRSEKKKLAWAVNCPHCKKEGPPELDKKGEKLVCSFCEKELDHLTKPFAQMIKVNLQAQRRANGG